MSSRRAAALILLLLAAACSADAQPGRRSQRGTVTQMVNGAELAITYYRPVLRGRTPFPGIVPWGRTWAPGADSATRLETSRDVEIEGSTLPGGRYSLWVIPAEKEPGTVIFNRTANAFHLTYDASQDALRVQSTPVDAPSMETLAFYFPVVDADSALLVLHWGTTMLPLHVRVRGAPGGTARQP
jgi:hypothetical protein